MEEMTQEEFERRRAINKEPFEMWALSEGRSIKPASEYSPQVYASTPSNNAFDGWCGRQDEVDALKDANAELVKAAEEYLRLTELAYLRFQSKEHDKDHVSAFIALSIALDNAKAPR